MVQEELIAAGIDVEEGLHRFMNSEQMFVKYLKKFVENDQYEALMKEIKKPEIDVNEAFERAHALKGICANLSLTGFLEVLNPVVEVLRKGSTENVREQVPELEARYEKVISAINQL